MSEPQEGGGGGGTGGTFSRPIGRFPLWVWMGLGLAGALVFSNWSKNKKAAAATANQGQAVPNTLTAAGSTSASLIPQFVNQVYDNPTPPVVNVTDTTPVTINNPAPAAPTPPPPVVQAPSPPPAPTPRPAPPPAPVPQAPQGQWVTVTPWNTPTSTLWGIARQVYGNGADWPRIFNANRIGVMRPDGTQGAISNPNLIYKGERVWVPA